jgi:hypothetical protein
MSGSRPSIFRSDNADSDIDLSGFAPKSGPEKPSVSAEIIHQVSDENGFHSRPPRPRSPMQPPLAKRPNITKSGRTVLLNARITQRAHDRFHAIIEQERLRYEAGELTHRVTLGEVVERALAALEREIGEGSTTTSGRTSHD